MDYGLKKGLLIVVVAAGGGQQLSDEAGKSGSGEAGKLVSLVKNCFIG